MIPGRTLIRLSAAFACGLIALAASPSFADVAPIGSCGGRHTPIPAPCAAAGMSSSTRTCAECAAFDAACVERQRQAGYSEQCSRAEADGGTATVFCSAASAQEGRDLSAPVAGACLLASLWAVSRLNRRLT
jgi:hypothetical protein